MILILLYTLCSTPQYITVIEDKDITVYPAKFLPNVLINIKNKGKTPVGAKIELDEVLGGQCS